MNNNYKIKETPNVSEASSFEDRKIRTGIKTSPLRNNKTMNNDYRTNTLDTPVQHNRSETYVETPRMRSSTCPLKIKSGLKTSALRNNKTMNNDYRTILQWTHQSHISE